MNSPLTREEIGILKRLASVFPAAHDHMKHPSGKLSARMERNSRSDWWDASSEDPSALRKARSRDGHASLRVDHESLKYGREWVCSVMTSEGYSSGSRPVVFVAEGVDVVHISKGMKHW